jgi:hypothetical protein
MRTKYIGLDGRARDITLHVAHLESTAVALEKGGDADQAARFRGQIERRPRDVKRTTSEMGRSRIFFDCPFCGIEVAAYAWSMAGHGGKHCGCGAFHRWGGPTVRVAS